MASGSVRRIVGRICIAIVSLPPSQLGAGTAGLLTSIVTGHGVPEGPQGGAEAARAWSAKRSTQRAKGNRPVKHKDNAPRVCHGRCSGSGRAQVGDRLVGTGLSKAVASRKGASSSSSRSENCHGRQAGQACNAAAGGGSRGLRLSQRGVRKGVQRVATSPSTGGRGEEEGGRRREEKKSRGRRRQACCR